MVKGIGVDMVYIPEIRRLTETFGDSFTDKTFTQAEREYAERSGDAAQSLAGFFAVKEAVFKALDHLTGGQIRDLRCVETLHHEDGAPYVQITEPLAAYMEKAGVSDIQVSVTNEKDYATAFAVVQ